MGAVSVGCAREWGTAVLRWALLTLMVPLAGCVQAAQATVTPAVTDEPSIGVVKVVTDPGQVSRPLDAYRPSPSQIVALAQAQARLMTACYAQHGSSAVFNNGDDLVEFIGDPAREDTEWSSLWGFFAPASVAHVYHRESTPLTSGPSTAVAESVTDDCTTKVEQQMPFGQDWSEFLHVPQPDGLQPVTPRNDSRVVAIVEKWAQCMASSGFHVSDPTQSMTDALGSTASSDAEVSRAAADLRCKQETNLVGVEAAVLAAYDQQFIEANRGTLERYRSTIDDFLKR